MKPSQQALQKTPSKHKQSKQSKQRKQAQEAKIIETTNEDISKTSAAKGTNQAQATQTN